MAESDCTVVGIPLFDKHMAIEAPHLGDCKNANAAEAARGDRKHLSLCDICAQYALAVTLQAVECDGAGGDVALQRAAR